MYIKILLPCLLIAIIEAKNAKYATEKPDFLTPCDLDDSSFGQCLSKNLQNAFVEWKDGLPGTNTLGAFDPLILKTLTITQANPNNVIQLKSNMKNVHMSGASKLIVKRARYYPKRNMIKALFYVPKLSFDVDVYRNKGHVLSLQINAQGDGQFEGENLWMLHEFYGKTRITPEGTFFDVQDVKVSMRKTGEFRIQLNNLFRGNEELENIANKLFNDSWRQVYEIIRPAVELAIEAVMLDRAKKTFDYVPIKYLISNFD